MAWDPSHVWSPVSRSTQDMSQLSIFPAMMLFGAKKSQSVEEPLVTDTELFPLRFYSKSLFGYDLFC